MPRAAVDGRFSSMVLFVAGVGLKNVPHESEDGWLDVPVLFPYVRHDMLSTGPHWLSCSFVRSE